MTVTAPSTAGTTVTSVFGSILTGIEGSIFNLVLSVIAIFMPQLAALTANDLNTIGNNFRSFLSAIGTGTPWGQALSDMMTADWNTVEDSAKQVAIDFASAVATALEKMDLLPQGQ